MIIGEDRIIDVLRQARAALVSVPEVGGVYDQQHSDTQLRAYVEIDNLLTQLETDQDGGRIMSKLIGWQIVNGDHWNVHGEHPLLEDVPSFVIFHADDGSKIRDWCNQPYRQLWLHPVFEDDVDQPKIERWVDL